MRVPRFCSVAIGAVSVLTGSVACAGPAVSVSVTAPVNYVALGDSYSAGVGAGSYESDSGSCRRSGNAYPQLWAKSRSPVGFKFVACSGARTDNVLNSQLSAITPDTTLVTITVGGNDAGFTNVMQACVLESTGGCTSAVKSAEDFMTTELPDRLDGLYAAMKGKAPAAKFIVLGYPHLYKIVGNCAGLNNTKRNALNRAADALDATIAAAVSRASFTYSDVRDEFAGHELCSGDRWLNSVSIPIDDSYHPTARGQSQGYYPALNSVDRSSQG